MFKKLRLGSNIISLEYCKILLLVLFAFSKAEYKMCFDNKPCQNRGGCITNEETLQPSFLSTKCVCARGYSGRWCQFQGKILDILHFNIPEAEPQGPSQEFEIWLSKY